MWTPTELTIWGTTSDYWEWLRTVDDFFFRRWSPHFHHQIFHLFNLGITRRLVPRLTRPAARTFGVECHDNKNWLVVNGCHQLYFPRNIGLLSSSQLTNSYFSEGWVYWPTKQIQCNGKYSIRSESTSFPTGLGQSFFLCLVNQFFAVLQ